MTGQDAVNVAQTFNERLDITGLSLQNLMGTLVVVRLYLSVLLQENQLNSQVVGKN